jgi:hypothetical protein
MQCTAVNGGLQLGVAVIGSAAGHTSQLEKASVSGGWRAARNRWLACDFQSWRRKT